MECKGFTIPNRNQMKKFQEATEIMNTAVSQRDVAEYAVGSQYEGTTCPPGQKDILRSDKDFAIIYHYPRVETGIANTTQENCLLLVEDESTPAGYAKLQQVQNGIPLTRGDCSWLDRGRNPFLSFMYDNENRLVSYFVPIKVPENAEWNGPAIALPHENSHIDHVYGLECKHWPRCVREWPTRERNHGWPSADSIEKCKSMGCLLVPMGHPNSTERHLQCKISMTLQERLLVTQFNPVQLKCYILLKLIKNGNLPEFIEEETLTSYHCKQCMLFMVENTPPDLWKPENLVGCLFACLCMIRTWAKNGHCPNYFIPKENLFDGRVPEERRQELFKAIEEIATDIKTTLQKLQFALTEMFTLKPSQFHHIFPKTTFKINEICRRRNKILKEEYHSNIEVCVKNLEWKLSQLKGDMEMAGKTTEEIKVFTLFILPYVQPTLLSNMAALMVKQGKSSNSIMEFFSSEKYNQLFSTANDHLQQFNVHIDSSELKQASLFYMLGDSHKAKDILKVSKSREIFPVCRCKPEKKLCVPDNISEAIDEGLHIASEDLLKTIHVSPCVVFVPTEMDITPAAIKYEMLPHFSFGENVTTERLRPCNNWRNAEGNTNKLYLSQTQELQTYKYWIMHDEDRIEDIIHTWGIVDGQFLRHFLLYLSETKLGMTANSKAEIKNMEMLINHGQISHKETCLNLLGWIYLEQNHMNAAFQCFIQSLQEQSTLNAAAWHLCFLVCDLL